MTRVGIGVALVAASALVGCGSAPQPAPFRPPYRPPLAAASRYELPTNPAPRDLVAAATAAIRSRGRSIDAVRCRVVEWTDYTPVRAARQLDCLTRTLGTCYTWSFGVSRLELTLESVRPLCPWHGTLPAGSLGP